MSVIAVILIVLAVLLVVLFAGGLVISRRRLDRQDFSADVARADRALESARAEDRGWNRQLLHDAARQALLSERPGFDWSSLELVLVDDRPGVKEDRAHLMAAGEQQSVRVVLARDAQGQWLAERVD
jgi:hypothetical protein